MQEQAISTQSTESAPAPVSKAGGVIQQLMDFKNGLTMRGGDWGSLTQIFFDNLSTLLGALFAIQDMRNFGAPMDSINDIIWARIVPGVGLTMVLGNAYYSWQAIRLTKAWGRPYTAQPYGLNTPAAFAFVFNIMYPVYFANVGEKGPAEAFDMAYKVALAANFITGLISTVLAFFGPFILKVVPPAALLVPIAGIGVAFLGLEQVTNSLAAPIVGYNCILWVFLGWYAGVRLGFGSFRMPEALQVILVGVALGWATGINEGQAVQDAADLVKWYGPHWSANDLFADFGMVKDYMGIVIPIGISATATSLMCLVSAKQAGDPYPVRESMIVDGIGTMLASFFGSPFGTTLYIGHPAHKKSGAQTGYSLTNGIIYLLLSWFGILALMQSIVNQATIGPIVLFVGLAVNEEALNFIPSRHYAAYVVGLFPSIYDWVVNVANRSPIQDEFGGNINVTGLDSWFGVLAWKRGALLVSFVWVAMLVKVIDRHWSMAAVWSLIGAGFALFGIIHVPEAGFNTFSEPTWEQCSTVTSCTGEEELEVCTSSVECWDHGEQWMFTVGYAMLAATFAILYFAQKYGNDPTLKPPIVDEETNQAFADWFADAAVDTTNQLEKQESELAMGVFPQDSKSTCSEDTPEMEEVDIEGELSV
ncbi:Inherit from COG: Xanthine uracil vitamin C permease [Seminavis robusta]|uniref:Inherit from COG: Xanthine uracil vitamin C permease n=1 Tax=Seminavis robusta TaxID=568900 RepID=A0A9N8H787_9STRA|nr:Inherit from COG: Xanthine uracil vitamin C permease [Seminavis robusta]|eukprot:Sro170_g075490.1 Inherit from COG: Xanthine uracil vitamin C permease (647) ;mRNA; r:63053-65387